MKTIVIVYAISWLILLFVYIISLFQNKKSKKKDDAFEKFLNKHKSTKEKILDKLVYVIMIVFAPLVVFVIPYILIRDIKSKKQARIREEERERSERDEKEHIAVCTTNYSALVSEKQNQCGDDYIRIAKSLKKLVDKKSYQEIINLFDKTSLPAAMKLGVRECEHKGAGSVSRLVIETAENVREDNILILEIYASDEAYQQHLKTDHFQKYKQGTLHMVKDLKLPTMKPLDPETMKLIFKKQR